MKKIFQRESVSQVKHFFRQKLDIQNLTILCPCIRMKELSLLSLSNSRYLKHFDNMLSFNMFLKYRYSRLITTN